jgi:hypothetical protein
MSFRLILGRWRVAVVAAWLLTPTIGRAQQSGLLLGLRAGPDVPRSLADAPEYRTLWIAPSAGKMAVVATLPTLVVPRDDGFWRVDIEPSCGITEQTMEMQGAFLDSYRTAVWRRWGSARTHVPPNDEMDCARALDRVRTMVEDTTGLGGDEGACNVRELAITYASPKFVSYSMYTAHTEFCSPGRYASRTRLFVAGVRDTVVADPPDSTISVLEALTPARAASLEKRWSAAVTDCTHEESPDANWGIIRGVGEWVTDFSSTGPTVCRGDGMAEFDIRERIPASMARNEPREWLERIRRVVPKVDDFLVSPRQDVIVVRRDDTLNLHAPRGEALGQPLLSYALRPGERVIMAEWALGSHVARWTKSLRSGSAEARHPPARDGR